MGHTYKMFTKGAARGAKDALDQHFHKNLENAVLVIPTKEQLLRELLCLVADFQEAKNLSEEMIALRDLYVACVFGSAAFVMQEGERLGDLTLEEKSEEEIDKLVEARQNA